jgi:putative PIN family toxin of toxin-antitoxin system
MIRVVIDTNILVSAMIASSGNEALVVVAINAGLVTPCFSAEIIEEYSDVLRRPKFRFSTEEISAHLALLRERGNFFAPALISRTSPDPEDDKFIACALAGHADFIVTGNKRHFPEGQYASAKIVNSGELLELITLEL